MKLLYLVILAVTAVSLCEPVMAEAAERAISLKEAKQLVLASLTPEARKLPGAGIDGSGSRDTAFPAFFTFTVTWTGSPGGGSAIVGYYDVNLETGDVYSGVACEELATPQLKELQTQLRARFGLPDVLYKKLKKKGPYCD